MAGIESARCGRQFANVKDPDQQFEAVVIAARPDELLLKYLADRIERAGLGTPAVLATPLKKLDDGNFNVTSIADQSIDTVLQIEGFNIRHMAWMAEGKPCSPRVTVDIVWHLIRVRDGKQIATGSGEWGVISGHRISAFYQDAEHMRNILNELLATVATRTMCDSGADSFYCSRAR
jgi:hypothetical protein